MRTWMLGLVAVLTFGSRAEADVPAELAKVRDRLIVLTDGKGHYVVTTPASEAQYETVGYYGDGKTMYGRAQGWRVENDDGVPIIAFMFGDPRVSSAMTYKTGVYTMKCATRSTRFAVAGKDETARILSRATFAPPRFDRQPLALAHDDTGVFYYVDAKVVPEAERPLISGEGELRRSTDYQVYIGKRGAMKKHPLKELVDFDVTLLVTTKGSLKLRFDRKGGTTAEWIQGDKREALNNVLLTNPVQARVLGGEFGIYTGMRFDTPCDDL